MSFEIEENNNIINTQKSIEIETNSVEDIETNPTIEIKAEVEKWVITGDDIYIANQTTDLPIWYKSLIDSYITNESTIANDVSNLNDTFSNFETGYNQTIGTIENNLTTLTYDLTTNYVTNGTYNAGIQNLQLSKIDESGATTVAENVIGSWQNDPNGGGAWFDNKISTFSSTQESQATSISSLSTQYNGLVVSISEVDEIAQDAYGWSANSSKLITAGDNSITGWSFGDGSNIQSTFNIYADNFTISDGTNTTEPPFSVVAGSPNKVQFNGVVSFTNTDMSDYDNSNVTPGATPEEVVTEINDGNTTTIDGGRITTGTIDAIKLTTNYAWVGGFIQSSDYDGTNGFQLKSNAAGTSADPTIYGAYIKGVTLEAPNIISQDILKIHGVRETTLYAVEGNVDIISYQFTLDAPKKVLISIDSHYRPYMGSISATNDALSMHLLIDGATVYDSGYCRPSDDAFFHIVAQHSTGSSSHWSCAPIWPQSHRYIADLDSGPHNITWRLVRDYDANNIQLTYTYRSIMVEELTE